MALSGRVYVLGGFCDNVGAAEQEPPIDSLGEAPWLFDAPPSATVESADPSQLGQPWRLAPPMLQARARLAAAKAGGVIVAAGGCSWSTVLRSVEYFDPRLAVWTATADMSTGRASAAAATVVDSVVCCGGFGYQHPGERRGPLVLSSVEKFVPARIQWQALPPMREAREGHQLAAIDSCVFALGVLPQPAPPDASVHTRTH